MKKHKYFNKKNSHKFSFEYVLLSSLLFFAAAAATVLKQFMTESLSLPPSSVCV